MNEWVFFVDTLIAWLSSMGKTFYVRNVDAGNNPPAQPTIYNIFTSVSSPTFISVSWHAVSGAVSYTLRRQTGNNPPVVVANNIVLSGTNLTYSDGSVQASTIYSYIVSGVNQFGEGLPSFPATITSLGNAVNAPNLTATIISSQQINLNLSYTGPPAAATYNYLISTTPAGPWGSLISGTSTTASYAGLTPSTTYYFKSFVVTNEIPSRQSPDSIIISGTTQAAAGNAIRMTPGHYVKFFNNDGLTSWLSQIDGIANEPLVKGVGTYINWNALEGNTAGDYSAGFALIDALIARCDLYGKKLIVSVNWQLFGSTAITNAHAILPSYLDNVGTGPAIDPPPGLVACAKLYEAAQMDRFIALGQAYAARYKNNPTFEMWHCGETALSIPIGTQGYTSVTLLVNQYLRYMPAMRTAWPFTAVRIGTNFLGNDSNFTILYTQGQISKICMGGPDSNPPPSNYPSANVFKGSQGTDWRGTKAMPWVNEVQGPPGATTPTQLYNDPTYGFPAMNSNYWIWTRQTQLAAAQNWSTGILPFIHSINGAINNTRPTGY